LEGVVVTARSPGDNYMRFETNKTNVMASILSRTVVVADDHPGILHAVESVLRAMKFEVLAAVADGDLALHAVEEFHPDVVILDISMPRLDGLRTAQKLRTNGFDGSIIFLTIQRDDEYVSAAFASGARAYVLKSQMRTDLLHAIEEALAGKTFVSPLVSVTH
jgi:DNA-binding NarL/FixJ family response regulator